MKEKDNYEGDGFGRLFKANATSFFGEDDNVHFLTGAQNAELL
jgi:hypothetical protein